MSNTLKPCPFCGSAAGFAGGLYSYRVKCRACFAQTGLYVTEDLAANHWNTRAAAAIKEPKKEKQKWNRKS